MTRPSIAAVLGFSFGVLLMVADEILVQMSWGLSWYEFPLLGRVGVWRAWEIVFGGLVVVFLAAVVPGRGPAGAQPGTCGHCGLDLDVCRTCGQPIAWGLTARGKAMPLEAKPTVVAMKTSELDETGRMMIVRAHEPHWVRCPQSKAWTGKTRAELGV